MSGGKPLRRGNDTFEVFGNHFRGTIAGDDDAVARAVEFVNFRKEVNSKGTWSTDNGIGGGERETGGRNQFMNSGGVEGWRAEGRA